jgi:hypothetical protein
MQNLVPAALLAIMMLLAGAILLLAMYLRHRRRVMWHETARLAIERGQALPPLDSGDLRLQHEMMWHDTARRAIERGQALPQHEKNDVRSGLILLAVSAGLFLFLRTLGDRLEYVAAIPGFIGVAQLLNGLLDVLFPRKNHPRTDPPQT